MIRQQSAKRRTALLKDTSQFHSHVAMMVWNVISQSELISYCAVELRSHTPCETHDCTVVPDIFPHLASWIIQVVKL